jgi:hypothetical protein
MLYATNNYSAPQATSIGLAAPAQIFTKPQGDRSTKSFVDIYEDLRV